MAERPENEGEAKEISDLPHDLFPELYEELRNLARRTFRSRLSPGHTLQATALVHEAWLRLGGEQGIYRDRGRFYRAAATTMRHILINHARDKNRVKRGGETRRVALDISHIGDESHQEVDLVVLDEALEKLMAQDPPKARLVELRYFAGLKNAATAEALGISESTLNREWTAAKAWLRLFMEQASSR